MQHLCLTPKNDGEFFSGISEFVLAGLRKGELVAVVVAQDKIAPLFKTLEKNDFDLVEAAVRDQQLSVRTPEETYVLGGVFTPEKMISLIQGIIGYSKRRGFAKFRGVGELNWAMTGVQGSENIFNYEAGLNRLVKDRDDVSFLCVYDERVFPPKIIEEALLVHAVPTRN